MTSFADTLFDDLYWDSAPQVLAQLRDQGPVHQARLRNGVRVWVITRYAQACEALRDPRLSKDSAELKRLMAAQLAEAGHDDGASKIFDDHMLFTDGRKHARLRKKVAAWFTRRHVERLRPRVETISAGLLDVVEATPAGSEIDLISQYAFPLPVAVICEMLGAPAGDQHQFRGWTSNLIADDQSRAVPASDALAAYFINLTAAKRAEPDEGLLSMLVHDDEDDALTDEEVLATMFLLLVAGHETTTNAIANAARLLLDEPARWRALRENPDMIPRAVEELLRFDSPVAMATHRRTTEPVTIGGVTIPADQIVLVALGSANRDDEAIVNANQLDLRRAGCSHLSFGHGVHHCLGAPLARMEIAIALRDLTQRFPNPQLAVSPDALRRVQDSAINNAYEELPLLLTEMTVPSWRSRSEPGCRPPASS